MSVFFCAYHNRLEDSDVVGFRVRKDGETVCDDTPIDEEEDDDA